MYFNSFSFVFFLLVVLLLYYALSHQRQNVLLLIASYVFYGLWDWRFLTLLAGSTIVDFTVSHALGRSDDIHRRRRLLAVSITANLGVLAIFKYYGFFLDSLNGLLTTAGFGELSSPLRVIVPVGISFYTFQTLGYTVDVYRRRQKPVRDLGTFALYVAYFPQLVAGPIERASRLLPQLEKPRTVSPQQIATGLQLMLMGYLKKVAIADAVAPYVQTIFTDPGSQSSVGLMLGLYLFAIQIYGDFSGYSDIARGVSRLLGIELMVNFRQPYLSANITEFWRRWHISLSTWLRDYLYIPLGGNRLGRRRMYLNLMITMLLGGLWHGAAWTFVIWGGLHGAYLAIHKWLCGDRRPSADQPALRTPADWLGHFVRVMLTFHLVCLTWLFFRADSFDQAWAYLAGLSQVTTACPMRYLFVTAFYGLLVLLVDMPCWLRDHELPLAEATPWVIRGIAQATAIFLISFVGVSDVQPFIYFQF